MTSPPAEVPRLVDHVARTNLDASPVVCDWANAVEPDGWGCALNDGLRVCALSTAAHLARSWAAQTNTESDASAIVRDADVLAAYCAVAGYRVDEPGSDRGTADVDVLEHWRRHGLGAVTIDGYLSVDTRARAHVAFAIDRFCGAYASLDLPRTAQAQDTWTVPARGATGRAAPGTWMAHAVALVGYDASTVTCIAWGARRRMTWAFLATYGQAVYAVVGARRWLRERAASAGVDLRRLYACFTGGQ